MYLRPHPEERAIARISKDGRSSKASWFETHGIAVLLTMRV